ncbi:MAG: GNAT family N-acetyltransferase [Candidatus Latescibacterota bacterium]|nr:GNAT family N-acetyltransferase [Candidatus Latescibacterota bacterium]
MKENLGAITLKSGEVVEAVVITGPDQEWAERVESLLGHKGRVWRWQISQNVREPMLIDAKYYLLVRDDIPFANMLTAEYEGVGHFGHVYTRPEDRRQGAASQLMALLMADFRRRGGRALFLGTGYDSHPHHIYASHGFRGLEPMSGRMSYFTSSASEFEVQYFPSGRASVREVTWTHWPTTAPLFTGDYPGVVRCLSLGLLGRASTEGPLLDVLQWERESRESGEAPRSLVLEHDETSAVVGYAMWSRDPLWPGTCIIDIYCHPGFWDQGRYLLEELTLPETDRVLAYCDCGHEPREGVLAAAGFRPACPLAQRVAADAARTGWVDVQEWEKV